MASNVGQPDDPNAGLRSDLLEDVLYMRSVIGRPADYILISGDIAFAGLEAEYDFAYRWLELYLCPAAGCAIEMCSSYQGTTMSTGVPRRRRYKGELEEIFVGAQRPRSTTNCVCTSGINSQLKVLFHPIEHYNRFAAKFLCALGPYATPAMGPNGAAESSSRPFATR